MSKKKNGRPSKLTSETVERLCDKLRMGHTYAVACAHAGIHYTCLTRWKVKGRDAQQGEFHDFFNTVNQAEMEGRQLLEARALTEAKPLDILERRYPDDWGKTDRVEHDGQITFNIIRDK